MSKRIEDFSIERRMRFYWRVLYQGNPWASDMTHTLPYNERCLTRTGAIRKARKLAGPNPCQEVVRWSNAEMKLPMRDARLDNRAWERATTSGPCSNSFLKGA